MGKDIVIHKDILQNITYYQRDTKSSSIYAYFRVNGKTHRFSTRTTSLPEASKVAHKKHHLASKGRNIKKVTFKKLLDKYLEYKKSRVSERHFHEMTRNGKMLLEYFGDRDINLKKISNKSLIGLENWRRNYYQNYSERRLQKYTRNGKTIEGRTFKKTLSNRTINVTVKLAVSVIKHAVKNELINETRLEYKALKEGKRESFLDETQLEHLYEHFIKEDKEFCAFVVAFCFYTGIRYPGESFSLQWRDIDFERTSILIRNRKHKTKVLNTAVPMLPPAENILRELEKYQKSTKDQDYVFRTRSGRRIKNISKSFKKAIRELNFDTSLSMYSLRHSFITHLIVNYRNISRKMIAEVAGHSDTSMIDNVYGHLREDIIINAFVDNHKELEHKGKVSSKIGNTQQTLEEYI